MTRPRLRLPARWPVRWGLPIVLLVLLAGLQAWMPGWAGRLELWLVDLRFQVRGTQATSSPIVIVALDERSFQMLGDLQGENIRTWPRLRCIRSCPTTRSGTSRRSA